MKLHSDKTKAQLGELGALSHKTEAAERRILEIAEKRLEEVQQALDRPQVGADSAPDEDQEQLLQMTTERAQLHQVIARSKQALGE